MVIRKKVCVARARDGKGGFDTARGIRWRHRENGALAERSVCRRSKNVFATLTGLDDPPLFFRHAPQGGRNDVNHCLVLGFLLRAEGAWLGRGAGKKVGGWWLVVVSQRG